MRNKKSKKTKGKACIKSFIKKNIFVISAIVIIVGLISLIFIFKTEKDTVSSVITDVILVMGVVGAFIAPIIDNNLQRSREKQKEKAVYQIGIDISVLEKNYICFSASILNVGDMRIEPICSNLYIDQGIQRNSDGVLQYDFPFLLKHSTEIETYVDGKKVKDKACVLRANCDSEEKKSFYPSDDKDVNCFYCGANKSLYHTCVPLKNLSGESIIYILPKERFSEDVILQFGKAGVYRVTFVVVTSETAICECATKQFYISKSLVKKGAKI